MLKLAVLTPPPQSQDSTDNSNIQEVNQKEEPPEGNK
jgi:hypothetical protein